MFKLLLISLFGINLKHSEFGDNNLW